MVSNFLTLPLVDHEDGQDSSSSDSSAWAMNQSLTFCAAARPERLAGVGLRLGVEAGCDCGDPSSALVGSSHSAGWLSNNDISRGWSRCTGRHRWFPVRPCPDTLNIAALCSPSAPVSNSSTLPSFHMPLRWSSLRMTITSPIATLGFWELLL